MTDLVKVTFTGGPSGDWYSSMHFDHTLGSSTQDSVDTVKAFWDALKAKMTNLLVIHIDPVVTQLDPVTLEPIGLDTVTGYTINCSGSTDALPFQTQGCILWNTGVWIGGRQVRGKTYIPGITEAENDQPGVPGAGMLSAMATAAAAVVTPVDGVPVVASRTHGGAIPISAAQVSLKWALLRSRR